MAHEIIHKNELIAKLQAINGNPRIYVGGQYFNPETKRYSIEATGIIDVEKAPILGFPEALLIVEPE